MVESRCSITRAVGPTHGKQRLIVGLSILVMPCLVSDRYWIKFVHLVYFFFFNDTATTEIYTLSLHDALPICYSGADNWQTIGGNGSTATIADRKSTRLNSSHLVISYAVFCLKKKKTTYPRYQSLHEPLTSHRPLRSDVAA